MPLHSMQYNIASYHLFTAGSTKWSKEEDEILLENDNDKIIELSRQRGKKAVKDRVAFLGGCC